MLMVKTRITVLSLLKYSIKYGGLADLKFSNPVSIWVVRDGAVYKNKNICPNGRMVYF
jgi:hypothetical protein